MKLFNKKVSFLFVLFCLGISHSTFAFEDANGNEIIDLSDYNYDAKTFPGYGCIAEDPADASLLTRTDGWYLFNASAQPVTVLCPIVRDNVKNTNGAVGVAVNIYNIQNFGMDCTLRSHSLSGAVVAWDGDSTTVIGNSTLVVSVNASDRWAHYSLSCDLPSGNMIISYSIAERLRTDLNN